MTTSKLNPDSAILGQLDEQWQKIAAVLVWKLARDGVQITLEDFRNFAVETAAGEAVLFTHGHIDSIELSIVTAKRAAELAVYDANNRGTG